MIEQFTWTTRPKDLLEHFDNPEPILKKALHPFFVQLQKVGAEAASKAAPKYKGALQKSFFIGGAGTASSVSDYEMTVGTKLPYAKAQDSGQKPGKWPAPLPMRNWVQDVIKPGPDLENVVFLVARKIHDKGFHGHNFMEAGFKAVEKAIPVEGRKFVERLAEGFAK